MRSLLTGLAALALAAPASATWSIVLADAKTGEIAIGSATCLEGYDLLATLPVVVVGKGGGVAQSAIDMGATNRKEMFEALMNDVPADEIIELLKDGDVFKCSRQYGIATLTPETAGFTGACAGQYKGVRRDVIDGLSYAIQGNVLTAAPIFDEIEAAVLNTSGSVGDKLMAGMLAAQAWGGDGRCSCLTGGPTSCGAPPPDFEKSAHIGQMLVARLGDPDGVCNGFAGCANGDYWMSLNVPHAVEADPDPVDQLVELYADFLAGMVGHADGLQSLHTWDDEQVLGDGESERTLVVQLLDLDGEPATVAPVDVLAEHTANSAGLGSFLGWSDLGGGLVELTFGAGVGTGVDQWQLTFEDGTTRATLFPYPELEHRPALVVDGGVLGPDGLELDLLAPADLAGRSFSVGLSASGSEPGQTLGSVQLPLNPDRLGNNVLRLIDAGQLQGVPGQFDEDGRATVQIQLSVALLGLLADETVSLAAHTLRPVDWVSNAVDVPVEP